MTFERQNERKKLKVVMDKIFMNDIKETAKLYVTNFCPDAGCRQALTFGPGLMIF
jgi:hypothetical protein